MASSKKLGLYIHIPFCSNICSYCDFSKLYKNDTLIDKYLIELENEITSSYNNEIIDTVYIGGGTPSCLSLNQLETLFTIIKNKFNLDKNIEYTVECNFDSISFEKLDLMNSFGVNRISFGLESIDKENLKILDRSIDIEKIKSIIAYSNKIGIDNINVDLMYALPNESIEVLEKDLEFIKTLDITHISTYSLILAEHTKLKINGTKYIDEDLDGDMYDLICSKLSSFDHYEISNFAKNPKYRSKHNLKYWHNEEYYGYGLSSSGYEGNVRYTKTKSITKYLSGDYIKDDGIEILDKNLKIYYEIILGLRTKDGINLDNFKKKYNSNLIDYYDYQKLLSVGLLKLEGNNLTIPDNLWYISNSVILKLLDSEVVK